MGHVTLFLPPTYTTHVLRATEEIVHAFAAGFEVRPRTQLPHGGRRRHSRGLVGLVMQPTPVASSRGGTGGARLGAGEEALRPVCQGRECRGVGIRLTALTRAVRAVK